MLSSVKFFKKRNGRFFHCIERGMMALRRYVLLFSVFPSEIVQFLKNSQCNVLQVNICCVCKFKSF
ncbi:hypothetical protein EIP77_11475 [Shigella flexneri]|nr:hypothetical protein [Shigella flexneri]EFN9735067.1 hypothetical protein [Escherichia coli]EHF0776602.1 hypothetical protein [Shigella sonnei]EAA1362637.1 hypothetical protein [Shigella flexneri]EAA1973027.1 hypothetical protein [Shigella flexneri]